MANERDKLRLTDLRILIPQGGYKMNDNGSSIYRGLQQKRQVVVFAPSGTDKPVRVVMLKYGEHTSGKGLAGSVF
jgi:hypothetical protein